MPGSGVSRPLTSAPGRLFKPQDEADERKEKLIEQVESRFKQKIVIEDLSTVKWGIV